tara:strand:- start:337 stop:855 length:519 start_codon:yes stop_codon:yes gene_type:complete
MSFFEAHGELKKPVLNVVVKQVTATASTALSGEDEDGVGLDENITPQSSSSRILLICTISFDTNRSNGAGGFRIRRGGESGTLIANAPSAGNRFTVHAGFMANADMDQSSRRTTLMCLDHPNTTSSVNYVVLPYKLEGGTSMQFYLNRAQSDPSQNDDGRYVSTLTLIEFGN